MVMKSVQIGQNWEEKWMVFTISTPAEAHSCFFLEICLTNKFHHRGQGYFLNRLVKSLTMKT
jgi:hypothetical protein